MSPATVGGGGGGPRRDWIVQATDVLDAGPAAPHPNGAPLDVIDQTLEMASLITGSLPGEFFDWIADALDSFSELLNDFTGDSAAIVAHAEQCTTVADRVAAEAAPIAAVPSSTPQWTGDAATAFQSTMTATSACVTATGQSIRTVGARHLVLGGMVATVKQEIITAVTELAKRLVAGALEAIAKAGLALVDGAISVVSGAASGAVDGAVEGFKSGGPVGAVTGGVSGFVSGGADGAEEAARRLRAAYDAFVDWAGDEVAHVLGAVTDFVSESMDPMIHQIGEIKGVGQRAERAAALLTTGRDPGNNADAPADGTIGDQARGTGMQERDRDLIDLNGAIGDPDAELPEGYRRASDADLAKLGLTPEMMTDDNGFIAEVFVDADGNYVMAFAGTTAGEDPSTGVTSDVVYDDVVEDAAGAVTMSPQTEQVLAITEAISSSPNADNVMFTGHSLGGRLASIASLDTGNGAVTYNSAGVSPSTIDYVASSNGTTAEELTQQANDGQVRRYHTGNDPLTAAQERWDATRDAAPDALGHPIQIGPDDPTPYEGHTNDKVEEQFDQTYPVG